MTRTGLFWEVSAVGKFDPFKPKNWQLAHDRFILLGGKSIIMGILNVTPDSFSDGGQNNSLEKAMKSARKMIREGADIIDVGGESTRPGAKPVSAKQEQTRVLPIIEAFKSDLDCLISVDTNRASTAKLAINAGAHIVNDVWGFQKDKKIAETVSKLNAGCVLMHTGRGREKVKDPVKDHFVFLRDSISIAKKAKIAKEKIVLDPGFGFAKDPAENIKLLSELDQLFKLGYPILTGTSRKRFLGAITGNKVSKRDIATAATSVIARLNGSSIFRVHNVKANVEALKVADAIVDARLENKE